VRREAGPAGPTQIAVLLLILALFTPASLHSGSKGRKGDVVDIKFWHSITTENKDILNSLIDEFNQKHRGIRVVGGFQGGEEDLIIKLISQENLPDLALVPVYFLTTLKKRELIQPLESSIPQDLKDDISKKFWDAVTLDDHVWGVPFQFSTPLFYVNQHILRISGNRGVLGVESWDEILDITERIRANTDDAWGLFIPMENLIHFTAFVESFTGESPFDGEGHLRIDRDDIAEAMTYLQNLVYEREIMPPKITRSEAEQIFLSGRLGVMMGTSARLVYTQSNLPYNMDVWHLPHPRNTSPIITGSCLTVLTGEPARREPVLEFIDYLTSYESIIKWHTHTGAPAVRNSVKDSIDLLIFYEDNPNYTTSVVELEQGVLFNPRLDYLSVNNVVKKLLAEILLNRRNPAEALHDAQEKLDHLDGTD
jgi:ABC-type glycerol-3-phosphate transport system substrate-binding protein